MTSYVNPSTRVGGTTRVVVPERENAAVVDEAPFDDVQYVRVNGEWVEVDTPAIEEDTTVPKAPTNLSATGALIAGSAGVDYELSWDAPTQNTDNTALADFAYYVVRWRYAGTGPWASFVSNDESFLLAGLQPVLDVEWAVLARDYSGNDSVWASDTITGLTDTTGPDQPSTPSTDSSLGTIRLTWNGLDQGGDPPPADFSHLDVYSSATSGGPWTHVGRLSGAGSVIVTGVPVGETRYFSTIAVDTSGNESTRSTETTETVVGITGPDIEPGSITGSEIDPAVFTGLQAAIDQNTSDIAANAVDIAAAVSAALAAQAAANQAQTEVDAAEVQIAAAQADITAAQADIAQNQTDVAAAQAAADQAQTEVDAAEVQIAAAQADIATAQTDITAAQADITQAQADIVQNQTDVAAAQAAADQAQTEVDAAEVQIAAAQADITQAQSDVAAAQADADAAAATAAAVELLTDSWKAADGVSIDGGDIYAASIVAAAIAAGAIDTSKLSAGAVTAAKIAANTITAAEIASGAITTDELAANAVTAAKIAANTITAAEIASGAITTDELAANSVVAAKIAANTITAAEIASGAITTDELAANSVVAAKIAAGEVTATALAADSVTTTKIAAGAVTADELAANSVVAAKIAAGEITATHLASDSVTTAKIAAGAITAAEIAAGTITANELASNSVTAAKIVSGAITTVKLAAGAVTADQLAAGAVTTAKLAAGAVTADQIAAGAVVTDKLAAGSVVASKVAAGEIGTTHLAADSVTALKLAAGSVTTMKLAAGAVTSNEIAAGAITANDIAAGSLQATVAITGLLMAGDPSGARVEISDNGMLGYRSDGSVRASIPTNPAESVVLEGDLIADSLTTRNQFAVRGENNEISKGGKLVLSDGTSSPTSPPAVSTLYEKYDGGISFYLSNTRGFHKEADTSGDAYYAGIFFYSATSNGPGDTFYPWPSVHDIDDNERSSWEHLDLVVLWDGSKQVVVEVGLPWTEGGPSTVPDWALRLFDFSAMNSSGTTAPTQLAQLTSFQPWAWGDAIKLGRCIGAGLAQQFVTAVRTSGSSTVKVRRYNVTSSSITATGGTVNLAVTFAEGEGLTGVTYGSSAAMGYPGADQTIIVVHKTYESVAFTTGGVPISQFTFPLSGSPAYVDAAGSTAAGANTFLGFRSTNFYQVEGEPRWITKYTNEHWDSGSESDTWWVSGTWYDPDATGGTHETAQGPLRPIELPKRAALLVTVPPYPARPDPTTTDDVTAAKVYVGRGDTEPARVDMNYAGQTDDPVRSLTLREMPSGAAPPITSDFPASAPALITSADGVSWYLQGDGSSFFDSPELVTPDISGNTTIDGDLTVLGNIVAAYMPKFRTAGLTGPASTSGTTPLTWDGTTVWNEFGMTLDSGNNYEWSVPEAGTYIFMAWVDTTTTSSRSFLELYFTRTIGGVSDTHRLRSTYSTDDKTIVTTPVWLEAGDSFHMNVYADSGGSVTIQEAWIEGYRLDAGATASVGDAPTLKTAAGKVTITPVADTPTYVTVSFPPGRFDAPPSVVLTPETSVPGTRVIETGASTVTKDDFRCYIYRTNTTDTTVSWQAMEVG